MRKFFYFALALAFASCTNNEDLNYGIQDNEIRLTSGVVSSRAATQGTQIVKDESVYAWLDNADQEVVKAWKLVADGEGKLAGEIKYFPDGVTSLKCYALHANSTFGAEAGLPASIEHTVVANQKETANYLKSDLLFSIKDAVVKRQENPLNFYHMLSKVEVKLIAGEGYTNEQLANLNVNILGTKPVASLAIDKAKAEADIADQAVRKTWITASGNPAAISIPTKTDDYAEAVIVPQSVQGNFIQIVSGEIDLCYVLQTAKEFESGKNYKFDITVERNGLNVSTSISDWADGGTTSGAATAREFSAIEKALKAKDLLSGAVRDASTNEFKGYYFFDETFTNITSYIIEQTDDKKDLKVTTQAAIVAADENSVSWTTAFAGIDKMEINGSDIKVADGIVLDSNSNGVTDFLSATTHYEMTFNRDTKTMSKGDMSRLFKDEVFNDAVVLNTIELNCGGASFAFTTMPDHWTSYVNSQERISKDVMKFTWTGEFRKNGEDPMDINKGQESTTIKNLFESYHGTNIFVKKINDASEFPAFYIINKDGKGWLFVERQVPQN